MSDKELLIEVENQEPFNPRDKTKPATKDTVKRVIGPQYKDRDGNVPVQSEE